MKSSNAREDSKHQHRKKGNFGLRVVFNLYMDYRLQQNTI